MIKKVVEILSEISGIDEQKINRETHLLKGLGLNSLDIVNAIVEFEDTFGIEIPDREIKQMQTVDDILFYLEKHV